MHASFLIIVVLFALGSEREGLDLLSRLGWLGIIFTCITAHEMAHSLMAQRRGIGVRSITLLPIGGVSQLDRIPEDPRDEFAIAIVGPLMSAAIAILFGVAAVVSGAGLLPIDIYSGALLPRIAWFNLLIAGFNLLPAFPMDGGRLLRAAVERRMDRVAATKIAARVGRAFAGAMIVAGFFWNPWLAIIGFFVFLGASTEEAATLMHSRLKGVLVGDVMLLDPVVIDADRDASESLSVLRRTAQSEFPVVRGEDYAGIVSAEKLETIAEQVTVGEIADVAAPAASSEDALDRAVDVLAASGHRALTVVTSGKVVGLLRLEDVRRTLSRRQVAGSSLPQEGPGSAAGHRPRERKSSAHVSGRLEQRQGRFDQGGMGRPEGVR